MTTWNPLAHDLPRLPPQHVRVSADLFAPGLGVNEIEWHFRRILDACRDGYQISLYTEFPDRMRKMLKHLYSRIYCDYEMERHKLPDNLALGVVVRTQAEAEARLPVLLQVPAAVRAVRVVPREAISLTPAFVNVQSQRHGEAGYSRRICEVCSRVFDGGDVFHEHWKLSICLTACQPLAWVTVAGEADPIHPQHVRDLQREAQGAGVPFSFEGWGEWRPLEPNEPAAQVMGMGETIGIKQSAADDPGEIYQPMIRVGAERSGRRLDGEEYDALPKAWAKRD